MHLNLCLGPLQYSWASSTAQLVKNLPAIRETWVRSLGWEGPLEKGKVTYSSILAWRISWTVHGVTKSQTLLSDFHFHTKGMTLLARQISLSQVLGSN